MKVICKKVVILSKTHKDEITEIIFEKGDKIYKGALFFPLDSYEQVVCTLLKETFEGNDIDVLKSIFKFYLDHANVQSKNILTTCKQWQYINGFSNYIINRDIYHLPTKIVTLPTCKTQSKKIYYMQLNDKYYVYKYTCSNKIKREGVCTLEEINYLIKNVDAINNFISKKIIVKDSNRILTKPFSQLRNISLDSINVI